jgi:uncharacterized protein (TIGR00369 family)
MTDDTSEILRGFMKMQDAAAFFKALGGDIVHMTPGRMTMRLPYAPHLVGNPDTGVVHGGAITAMLDHACGMAVGSALGVAASHAKEPMRGIATLDLRVDTMLEAKPGVDIMVIGECVKITQQIVFARAHAWQESEDNVIATASGTFILTEMRTGG